MPAQALAAMLQVRAAEGRTGRAFGSDIIMLGELAAARINAGIMLNGVHAVAILDDALEDEERRRLDAVALLRRTADALARHPLDCEEDDEEEGQ